MSGKAILSTWKVSGVLLTVTWKVTESKKIITKTHPDFGNVQMFGNHQCPKIIVLEPDDNICILIHLQFLAQMLHHYTKSNHAIVISCNNHFVKTLSV